MNIRHVRRFAGSNGILLLVTLVVSSTVVAQAPSVETITLVLKAPPYQFTAASDGYTDIRAEDCNSAGQVGQPLLPHQLVDVVLPPDVAWDSLTLVVRDAQMAVVSGTHRLRTAVPDQPGTGPDLGPMPAPAKKAPAIARIAATGQMRKWCLARVDFCPFQYDEATGQLHAVDRVTVELHFARTGRAAESALLADTVLDDVAAARFVNYATARAWYPQTGWSESSLTYDYVIITTNDIEANSTKLTAYTVHQQARGHRVLVVTEDDYGTLTGQAPNGRAEKIRQWLKNNYVAYGIKYVLLIGNPTPDGTGTTALPMKTCWPIHNDPLYGTYDAPTDYFFADLTGNWDKDGDQYFGEWGDDIGTTGVDLTAEVFVGRIPFYGSYTDLGHILQKTMDYDNETCVNWRRSILLPMSFSAVGYDGAPLAEQMWDDYLHGAGFSRWRQYQQGNGTCGLDSIYASEEELRGGTVVRDRWAGNAYGIVCWWGHGSETSAVVGYGGCWDGTLFGSSQTSSLTDTQPAFTYQCSCTNGYPEISSNLQYAILRRGGIATVSASRLSWFNTLVGYGDFDGSTTNSGIGYEYVKGIVAGNTASEALYQAKSSMTPEYNTRLMNYYDFNLYGDPAVQLVAPPLTNTYIVCNTNPGGPDSLSQAILNTNATTSPNAITFAAGVSGTIVLTGTLPQITDTLTINGPGARILSVSGDNTYGVMHIAANTAVTITGVTIQDGKATNANGGGIYSEGMLVLSGTDIVSNTATGSWPSGCGGGVYVYTGTVAFNGGQIQGNTATSAGSALYINGGSINLTAPMTITGDVHQAGGMFNGGGDPLRIDGGLNLAGGTFNAPTSTLTLTGDFTHSGGSFSPHLGTILFAGAGAQTISGNTAFYNLTVGSGVTLTTSSDVTVTGVLSNSGWTKENKSMAGTVPFTRTFGLANVAVGVNTLGSLSSLEVVRRDQNHPQATEPFQTGRWWRITPTGSGFTVTLILPHNNVPQPYVSKYLGGGVWDSERSTWNASTVTRVGITALSDWAVSNGLPTGVTLASFTATAQEEATVLAWETANEADILGFHVYRAESPDGTPTRLTAALIQAQKSGQAVGASYTYRDETAMPGTTHHYWLEVIDVAGQPTRYGPIAAGGRVHIYLPLVVHR